MENHFNLGEFFLEKTRGYNALPAFIVKDGGNRTSVSYEDFYKQVLKLSEFFSGRYLQPGFKIGLWAENRMEWCATALAVWKAGGVLVPLMHISTEAEVKRIISAARLDSLCLSAHIRDLWKIKREFLGVEDVFLMDFSKPGVDDIPTAYDLFQNKTVPVSDNVPLQTGEKILQDLAVLIFTSGTTGHPKGVMLSHENIIHNIQDTISIVPGDQSDRAISVLPLSHMFELVAGFSIVHLKGACISYPDSLKPDDILKEMREHRATMMAAVPLMFEIMDRTIQEKLSELSPLMQKILFFSSKFVRNYPFLGKLIFKKVHAVFGGHIKYFFTGGAKIDPEIIFRFQSLGIRMLQGYGLTETSPIISFTTVNSKKYTSVGRPVKSIEIKIDRPSEIEGEGQTRAEGEICVRGASVFKGYFENDEATREAFKDGWFHTGDLGHLDSENYIFITGRKKDMIVTPNGKNVYPEELEEILKTSRLFSEVAIIGIETGRGESVHAVIVPAEATQGTAPKELIWDEIKKLTLNIADYKKIQGLTLSYQELPKTPTKKIKKHLLKEMIKQGKFDSAVSRASNSIDKKTPLEKNTPTHTWLSQKLTQISKKEEIWKEADLKQDLGMDSLTFMEVISQIESQWSIEIPDAEFSSITSVQHLLIKLELAPSSELTSNPGDQNIGKLTNSKTIKKDFDFHHNNTVLMNSLRVCLHLFLIRPLLKIFFRFSVKNKTGVAANENLVFTPNHASHFDLLMVLSALPLRRLKNTYAVAAEDYFFNSWPKSFFVRLFFNAIPFDRKVRIEKGFRICEQILEEGGSLVIFPEGTRSPDGQLSRFKPGVGRLLANQKYKAVPTFIEGAFKAFPKGAKFPRLTKVSVSFGELSSFENIEAGTAGYQKVANSLQISLEKLRGNNQL